MRKITCMLVCAFLLCTHALAMPSANINNETRIVNISGVSAIKNGTVSVTIVKKQNPQSVGALSDALLFYELETNSDGGYSGKFYLPDSSPVSCYYNVYVSGDDEPAEFYRSSSAEITDCVVDFAKVSSPRDIDPLLNKYLGVLGINLNADYSLYPSWSQNIMFQQIKKSVPQTVSVIASYFDTANEAAKTVNGNKEAVLEVLNKNMLGNLVDEPLSYKSVADMYVLSRRKISADTEQDILSQIKTDFRAACALVKINSSTKGVMTSVLEQYNDVLSLDLNGDYSKLSKVEVNKALVSKDFTSIKSVRDAFEKSVSDVKNSKKGSSSQSSGSGSSAGSSAGKIEMPSQTVNPYDNFVPFNDIYGVEWAREAILYLYRINVISGYEDGSFKPDNKVSRAEFTKLALSLISDKAQNSENEKLKSATAFAKQESNADSDENDETAGGFHDVLNTDWYSSYIEKAASNGIITGFGNLFMPNNNITREDAAVIIYRLIGKKLSLDKKTSFADDDTVSDYAKDAVSILAGHRVINGMGNGSFEPKSTLTRAQAAVLIKKSLEIIQ